LVTNWARNLGWFAMVLWWLPVSLF